MRARRGSLATRLTAAGTLVAGTALACGLLIACTPSAAVRVSASTVVAADDATVPIPFTCTTTSACTGETRLKVKGVNGPVVAYTVPAGSTRAVSVPLSAAQQGVLPAGASATVELRIKETAPAAVAALGIQLTLRRPSAGPPTSTAYRDRNWSPTAFDTCSAELHRSFSVIGPDGKLYPTWHPPTVVDPATGETCTFGHEHGDDPASSDIYEWVTDALNAQPAASRGIPFGYVSEALDTWAADADGITRHEDNVGHKVIVADDVRLVTASPRGYLRDDSGQPITCDHLIKVHQGSHSGDALINNAHELLYAARCSDGTEIISSTMTRFGDANEFNRSCDGSLVATSGSNLPPGTGGQRRIPDRTCVDRNVLVPSGQSSSIWALYEVWESMTELTTADGSVLASFDPWFGVRNPARAHAGGTGASTFDLVDVTDLTDPADGGTARGYPFDEIAEREQETGAQLAKPDPASPFDGAQRDHYLHATTVANAGGPTTWYTDPWGGNATTTPRPGLVRQHLSATDNTSWPNLERRSFDLQRDHGAGNGVHAPN